MVTQTVTARDGMKVVLANDNHQLTEVVVTGMTQQDKRLFSGAATKIDASKAKLDGMADVSRSLEGRAAGVSVQNVSGTFGTAPKIRVRGATSIFGSSKPLWVVDGVIMEDIANVDASSLSSGEDTSSELCHWLHFVEGMRNADGQTGAVILLVKSDWARCPV